MKCAALTSFFRANGRFIVKDHIGQLFNLAGYEAWAWTLLVDGRMVLRISTKGLALSMKSKNDSVLSALTNAVTSKKQP